jgi:ATP-dependent Clp protease ATP-binding subunit ClpC
VIGQNEAVAAIVERIAMLKAGLNDPGKPIGVFLFAGSTGTGKTELAKRRRNTCSAPPIG